MKKILIISLLSFSFTYSWAQQVGETQVYDSVSLLHAFKKGKTTGQFRYYFSATDNTRHLTDYYAHAVGGALKFETAPLYNFQLGIGGSFVFNLGSSNLDIPDPETQQMNRYEIGLFDIEDPLNRYNIKRLEELYLKFQNDAIKLKAGRQFINTPFINLQDGRMRPTAVEGLWFEINPVKPVKIEAGYLTAISPRSTTRWFDPGKSIGMYPQGVNVNGVPNNYAENIRSKGIAVIGIDGKIGNWNVQLWEQHAGNIFNTVMIQADYQKKFDEKNWFAGTQIIWQHALNDGGHSDPAKTFFEKNGKSFSFGGRAGIKTNVWETSFNYNRITAMGRYLMPREWGKDPFYTFMPRERNDGFGDADAYVVKMQYQHKEQLKSNVGIGYFKLPAVTNFFLNKYAMPSYYQLNIDVRYSFNGVFKGLEAHGLYVHKWNAVGEADSYKYLFNKTDMNLYNFILNYSF